MFVVDVPTLVCKQWPHLQRLVSGVWRWKMQLPSVTSPVASSTYFQQEGRLLLNTKHKKPVILCSSRRFDCVCVCVFVCVSAVCYVTWREDAWVEAHLKDDVADRAHFFTSSSYCLSSSRVTYTLYKQFVKHKMAKFCMYWLYFLVSIQLGPLKHFLPAVAHSSKPPFLSNISLTRWVNWQCLQQAKEPPKTSASWKMSELSWKCFISHWTHLCWMKACTSSGFSLQRPCVKLFGSPESEW